MDDALEARFERIRYHLPRPLAGRGNLLNENTRTPLTNRPQGIGGGGWIRGR